MADAVNTEPAECAAAYRELRARVCELVRAADPAALDALAPATPEWRVRDILAHVSGVNTDIMNGNLDGVASDAWTDAQVATRRDWTIDALLDEWQTNGSAVEANAPILGAAAGLLTAANGDVLVVANLGSAPAALPDGAELLVSSGELTLDGQQGRQGGRA